MDQKAAASLILRAADSYIDTGCDSWQEKWEVGAEVSWK